MGVAIDRFLSSLKLAVKVPPLRKLCLFRPSLKVLLPRASIKFTDFTEKCVNKVLTYKGLTTKHETDVPPQVSAPRQV